MTKLKAIYSLETGGRKEIRVDWDNDRHQAITLKNDSPESLAFALKELAELIKYEIASGEIEKD
jgi:hypothetical protein